MNLQKRPEPEIGSRMLTTCIPLSIIFVLTNNSVLNVPDGQERRMEQRVHVVPGREYVISFYYSLRNPTAVESQCTIFAVFDYYTQLKRVPLPTDTEYHFYSERFIAQDNLDPAIEIGIACPSIGNGYTPSFFIDDASVRDPSKDCDTTPVDPNVPPQPTLLIPEDPESPRCPINVAQVPGMEPVNGYQAWTFYDLGEFVQDASNARTGEWSA